MQLHPLNGLMLSVMALAAGPAAGARIDMQMLTTPVGWAKLAVSGKTRGRPSSRKGASGDCRHEFKASPSLCKSCHCW